MANMIGILHSGWAENVHFPTVLGRCCCYLCIIRCRCMKKIVNYLSENYYWFIGLLFFSLSFSVKLALHSVWIHLKIKRC